VLLLNLALVSAAFAEPAARSDLLGDALPTGARARLGSSRLRHGGKVNVLLFSADGATLVSGSDDRTVCLWETATGKEKRRLTGHEGSITALAYTDAGRTLVSTGRGRVRLWDAANGEPRRAPAGQLALAPPLAVSADGRLVAVPTAHRLGDCTIRLRDLADGRLLHELEGHQGIVRTLAFSPNSRLLASGSEDETVRLWDAGAGKLLHKLAGHDNGIRLVVFAPDGKTLASVGDDETVRLWETDSGKQLQRIKTQPGWGHAIAFASDGRLAIGSAGGTIQIFASGSERNLIQWRGHPRMTCAVAWTPDGKTLASGGLDGRIRLWDPATGKEVRPAAGHQQAITHIGWSADGKSLATAGRDDTLRVWEAASGKEVRHQKGIAARGHLIALSPDGKMAAARRADGSIGAWLIASGAWDWQLPLLHETEGVVCLAFALDNQLVTAHHDGTIRLWNKAQEVRRFDGHSGIARRLCVSADGRFLVSHSAPQQLQLWDMATGKLLRSLADPPMLLWSLAMSPDGRVIAAGSGDFTIRLWETATGQPRGTLAGHRLEARALVFARDGRLLFSGGGDRTLRVWEMATGRERGHFDTPSPVNALALSADGRSVAAAGDDGTALVWDLALLPQQAKLPLEDLADNDLKTLWDDLADADAVKAHQAQRGLAIHRKQALAFLKAHLQRIAPVDDKSLDRLLNDLDSDTFSQRERATRELAELGELAEPALRKARVSERSPEVRRRVRRLLDQLEKARQPGAPPTPQLLRTIRAVEVLERLGNAEALALLADLSKGAAEARLTREAKDALQRLRPQPVGK
jgi:WD40 repeat protein